MRHTLQPHGIRPDTWVVTSDGSERDLPASMVFTARLPALLELARRIKYNPSTSFETTLDDRTFKVWRSGPDRVEVAEVTY